MELFSLLNIIFYVAEWKILETQVGDQLEPLQ